MPKWEFKQRCVAKVVHRIPLQNRKVKRGSVSHPEWRTTSVGSEKVKIGTRYLQKDWRGEAHTACFQTKGSKGFVNMSS